MNQLKIAITGPESCGKTCLAGSLAAHFDTQYIPEFAREYLTKRHGKYEYADLEIIARGQLESVQNNQGKILIADTEMLVMSIWSEVVFGKVSPFILSALHQQNFDLYFLCATDIPWEYDPLRENKHDRESLFELYETQLQKLNWPYIIVKGNEDTRLATAIQAIKKVQR